MMRTFGTIPSLRRVEIIDPSFSILTVSNLEEASSVVG